MKRTIFLFVTLLAATMLITSCLEEGANDVRFVVDVTGGYPNLKNIDISYNLDTKESGSLSLSDNGQFVSWDTTFAAEFRDEASLDVTVNCPDCTTEKPYSVYIAIEYGGLPKESEFGEELTGSNSYSINGQLIK